MNLKQTDTHFTELEKSRIIKQLTNIYERSNPSRRYNREENFNSGSQIFHHDNWEVVIGIVKSKGNECREKEKIPVLDIELKYQRAYDSKTSRDEDSVLVLSDFPLWSFKSHWPYGVKIRKGEKVEITTFFPITFSWHNSSPYPHFGRHFLWEPEKHRYARDASDTFPGCFEKIISDVKEYGRKNPQRDVVRNLHMTNFIHEAEFQLEQLISDSTLGGKDE